MSFQLGLVGEPFLGENGFLNGGLVGLGPVGNSPLGRKNGTAVDKAAGEANLWAGGAVGQSGRQSTS